MVVVSEELGARAQRPWARRGKLRLQAPGMACTAPLNAARVDTLLALAATGACIPVPVAMLAWPWRRRPAADDADRAGVQAPSCCIAAGPASAWLLPRQLGGLWLPGDGGEHDLAPEGRQGFHHL